MEFGYLYVSQVLRKSFHKPDRLLNSIYRCRQFSVSAHTMAKTKKKNTKRKKPFRTKDDLMDYHAFQSTSTHYFGPLLKKKPIKGDPVTDLKARIEYLQEGEHFNKTSDNQFVPIPETQNINKGKLLPLKKQVKSAVDNSVLSEKSDLKLDNRVSSEKSDLKSDNFNPVKKVVKSDENNSVLSEKSDLKSDNYNSGTLHNDSFKNSAASENTYDDKSNENFSDPSVHIKPPQQQQQETQQQETTLSSETKKKLTLSNSLKTLESFPLYGKLDHDLPFTEVLQPHVSSLPREPSVGNILRETMSEQSKAALDRWMKKKIRELGEDGFQQYKQALFRTGSNFHQCVAAQLQRPSDVTLLPEVEPLWESVRSVFTDITDVQMVEATVTHKQLGYMGILDSVIRYRDDLVLVDWKTADRQKKTLDAAYDDPVQILAYMGALNSDIHFNIKVDRGLLVVAYRDGRPADILEIPAVLCHMYWKQWLARLHKYWRYRLL